MQVIVTKVEHGEKITQIKGEGSLEECIKFAKDVTGKDIEPEFIKRNTDCCMTEPVASEETETPEEVPAETVPDEKEAPEEKETLNEQLDRILAEGDPKHYKKESKIPVSAEEDAAWNEAIEAAKQSILKARERGISPEQVKEAFNG